MRKQQRADQEDENKRGEEEERMDQEGGSNGGGKLRNPRDSQGRLLLQCLIRLSPPRHVPARKWRHSSTGVGAADVEYSRQSRCDGGRRINGGRAWWSENQWRESLEAGESVAGESEIG
ncbi:hypothetical protein LINPERHAP1_LOCUS16884, partial [Linum perenne]